MKPLGRKYYKNKTGGKHHIRVNGKFMCWWQDVCQPSKSLESRIEKEEIEKGKDGYYEEEIK